MIWTVEPAGSPRSMVVVTARLLSEGQPVGFAFERIMSPDAAPRAIFEYAIGSITCHLFRKAGYVSASPRDGQKDLRSE